MSAAWALHLLFSVLVVMAAVRAESWAVLAMLALFVAVYLPVFAIEDSRQWVIVTWLVVVCTAWLGTAVLSMDAAFIVFPLFFVVVRFLPPWGSAIGVAILTISVVVILGLNTGWNIGGVVGPVIGAGVAWVLGVGFHLLHRGAQEKAAAMEALVEARAEALQSSRRAGEMDERARIAGDIHDTVAQGLSSIGMLLSAVEAQGELSDSTRQQVSLAKATAAENLAETRRIIAAFQPAPLVGAGLPVALARIVSSTPMGEALSFDVDGKPREVRPEVEAALVRATQSLVSNIVRHSQATGAKVTLTYHPSDIAVDVVDNGVGFDPEAIDIHTGHTYGLSGVCTRIQKLGGTMAMESSPDQGAGISVSIPAPTKDDDD